MSDLTKAELIKVVDNLVGSITPIGETYTDAVRLENLRKAEALTEQLVDDLFRLNEEYAQCPAYSQSRAGVEAGEFLGYLAETYELDKFRTAPPEDDGILTPTECDNVIGALNAFFEQQGVDLIITGHENGDDAFSIVCKRRDE